MIECRHENEKDRLQALYRMELLDTPPEEAFDRITRLAKSVMEVPIVLVALVDEDRQWFKSNQGLNGSESPRDVAFCDHTIRQFDPLIVEDALVDERFAENPFVTSKPGIRFYAGVPLRTREGQNIGTLCAIDTEPRTITSQQLTILCDLAHMVIDEMELRLIATTDSLTGTLSRRAFLESAARDLARAKRKAYTLSCIVFDVDHFKTINDTIGHAGGDTVLQEVIAACRLELRKSDYIGRIGGEEFAIMMPDTDERSGLMVAERVRSGISDLAISYSGKKVPVTASFGVAGLTPQIGSVDELLKMADTAMYVAKADGRNRVVGSDELDETVSAA